MRWNVPAFTPETPSEYRRVRSSSAALRLNVVTRVRSGSIEPSRTRRATRKVSTLVLPAPAPATTQSSGSSDSTASRWAVVRRLAPGRASHVSRSKPSNVMTTLRTVHKGCSQHPPDLRLSWPGPGPGAPAAGGGGRQMVELDRECEVVVIGAGYSGLAAARHLARAGVEVLVLEARHRVGGRSFTDVTAAGFTVDRGGQWIGPTQDHLSALAAELGVAIFPTYTTGQGVELREGKRELYVGQIPTSDPHGAADGIACLLDLDLAAFEVPLDAPWDAAGAAGLDAQTLATWFDTHLESPTARAVLEVAVKAIFGTGPGELSLLFTMFYLHAGGGLANLARTTGGAQEGRFAGGSQQLAEGMAGELGERVVLGAPVETVAHGSDHVAVGARLVAPGADPADPAAAHRRCGCAPDAPSSPCRPRCAGGSPTCRRCRGGGTSSASACPWAP